MADIIEIEQLLARYAVGMTKDDVEAVVDVFTPDGTYSAFGDTYALDDFPTLVAAAPKGLFLTGTPVLELDGDEGTGEQTLCFVDQTNHDMRIGWYTRHLPAHREGLAAAHPRDDVPAPQRDAATRARPTTRAGPSRAGSSVELDEFRTSLDAWLDEQADGPGPVLRGLGHARRADRRSCPRSSSTPSTPAGCATAGPSGSAGRAARLCCGATSARRSPPGTSSSPASTR